MHFALTRRIVTPPAIEPVSLAEAKSHLRVDHGDDDQAIARLITAARQRIESDCARALIEQIWDVFFGAFPCGARLPLPFGQLRTVDAFEWVDTAGVTRSWTPSGGNLVEGSVVRAHVDSISERPVPGGIVLADSQTWPPTRLRPSNPIRVRFTCGFGATASAVPATLRQAILLVVGHLYDHRSEVEIGQKAAIASEVVQRGVDSLIEDWRLLY